MRPRVLLLAAACATLFLVPALGCAVEEADPDAPSEAEVEGTWTFDAEPDTPPVTAELVAEHGSIQPGGTTKIGVRFELEPGWHIYAEEPGDAGLPTKILWERARGVTIGRLVWPPAEAHVDPGEIRTRGYSGSAVLFAPLTASRNVRPGEVLPIRAKAEWLACNEICIPGTAELSLSLPVVATAPPRSAHYQLFDQLPQ